MKFNDENNFVRFNNTGEILDKLKQLQNNEDSTDFENLKKDLYRYSTFNIKQLFNTLALLENILIIDEDGYKYEYEYYKQDVLLTIKERNRVYTGEWFRRFFPGEVNEDEYYMQDTLIKNLKTRRGEDYLALWLDIYKKDVVLNVERDDGPDLYSWYSWHDNVKVWLDKRFPAHIIMGKCSEVRLPRYMDFGENIHLNPNAFDICKRNFVKNAPYGYNIRVALFEPNEIFVDNLNINEATLLNFNFGEKSFDFVDDFSKCVAWNFDAKSKYIFNFITELIRYRYNNRIDELKDIDLLLFTKEFLLNNFELIQKDCDNKITLDEVQQDFQKKLINL